MLRFLLLLHTAAAIKNPLNYYIIPTDRLYDKTKRKKHTSVLFQFFSFLLKIRF